MAIKHKKIHHYLNWIAGHWGFRMAPLKSHWFKNGEFFKVPPGIGCNEKHYNLWQIAKSVKDLNCPTAECGCLAGSSSYHIMRESNTNHFIFDSFQGLSEPTEYDTDYYKKGQYQCDMDTVIKNLSEFEDRLGIYPYWIPEGFKEFEKGIHGKKLFSLVNIDVDLYEPTKESIKFFWPRIVRGGILVCDDYGVPECTGAKKAMDDYFKSKVILLSSNQGIVFKGN